MNKPLNMFCFRAISRNCNILVLTILYTIGYVPSYQSKEISLNDSYNKDIDRKSTKISNYYDDSKFQVTPSSTPSSEHPSTSNMFDTSASNMFDRPVAAHVSEQNNTVNSERHHLSPGLQQGKHCKPNDCSYW